MKAARVRVTYAEALALAEWYQQRTSEVTAYNRPDIAARNEARGREWKEIAKRIKRGGTNIPAPKRRGVK